MGEPGSGLPSCQAGRVTKFMAVVRFVGRSSKRVAVAIVGGVLVLAGLAMLVLPGPGIVVVALGLAVLGTEFAWAAIVLEKGKQGATRVVDTGKRTARRAMRR